jgi:threonyl-tRNA synthetase
VDEQEFVLKPMNCPGHILIYQSEMHSYRDLPVKFFEFGTVYRYEKAGVLHGLLRVRGFTQDDAHIFCTPEQLQQQIIEVLEFALEMMRIFGFKYEIYLSTRPEKFAGTEEVWEMATNALTEALKAHKENFEIDPGAGVFYGPKIDIKMRDALGRSWQGPTVQVDFNNPERFDLSYIGPDGAKHRPVMIHRVVLGSLERFLGALIEHYAGDLPLWLAAQQVALLPITDKHREFAVSLQKQLENVDIRVFLDDRNENLNYKIRSAEVNKIPYLVVVGAKELAGGELGVRGRHGKDAGKFSPAGFLEFLKKEIKEKRAG